MPPWLRANGFMRAQRQDAKYRNARRRLMQCALAGSTLPRLGDASCNPRSPSRNGRLDPTIRAAADWLARRQNSSGEFDYGLSPCVNRPLQEQNWLRQAGATYAVACVALLDNKYAAVADRALDALLAQTTADRGMSPRRFPKTPGEINPLGFVALTLLAAVERFDASQSSALGKHIEELARFLRARQLEDGSLDFGNSIEPDGVAAAAGIDYFPGEALFAVARLHRSLPADWHLSWLAKARPFYAAYFADTGSLAFAPWQIQAYAAAFEQTKDHADYEFVARMAERLLDCQYGLRRRPVETEWLGGFGGTDGGHFAAWPPGIATACYAEGLAAAARAAKLAGDKARAETFRAAAAAACMFVRGLMFDATTTRHFEPSFRPQLIGAFHAGPSDGTVRIDFNQHAICAMLALEEPA